MDHGPDPRSQFGYRITSRSSLSVALHRCGRRLLIPAAGCVEQIFVGVVDASQAMENLRQVLLDLAASICATTYASEFEAAPTEFGFRLVFPQIGSYDVDLFDQEPDLYRFPDGGAIGSDGYLNFEPPPDVTVEEKRPPERD